MTKVAHSVGSRAKRKSALDATSLLLRGSKGFVSGGEDPLSNVSAGTGLPGTAESAGPSARCHTEHDRHPGEAIFSAQLAGVALRTLYQ